MAEVSKKNSSEVCQGGGGWSLVRLHVSYLDIILCIVKHAHHLPTTALAMILALTPSTMCSGNACRLLLRYLSALRVKLRVQSSAMIQKQTRTWVLEPQKGGVS